MRTRLLLCHCTLWCSIDAPLTRWQRSLAPYSWLFQCESATASPCVGSGRIYARHSRSPPVLSVPAKISTGCPVSGPDDRSLVDARSTGHLWFGAAFTGWSPEGGLVASHLGIWLAWISEGRHAGSIPSWRIAGCGAGMSGNVK